MELENILRFAVEKSASDIHFQAGSAPSLRITGQMRAISGDPLSDEQIIGFIRSIAPARQVQDMENGLVSGLDFSYTIAEVARFRCSAYRHLGKTGIVLRIIRFTIPSIDDLRLPKAVHDIALTRRGLTLVAGTTGSGKSTTLAAMVDLINKTYACKIITVEDPVEFLHPSQKALISQLEVGADTPSFAQALRQALRQNPDTILVGELRDLESLRMLLQAADTGHQVFSTVHSASASQTIERIIAMFPPAEHHLLLQQLAGSVEAIISQRLIATIDGRRVPAVEILRGNAVTRKLILENKPDEMVAYIASGESSMQSFDQHILKLYKADVISGTEAMRWATNPESLALAMRGIKVSGGMMATGRS